MLEAYMLSKAANILHARGIANKFRKDNILVYSLSLGVVEMTMDLAVPLHKQVALGILNEDRSKTDNPHWKTCSEGTAM